MGVAVKDNTAGVKHVLYFDVPFSELDFLQPPANTHGGFIILGPKVCSLQLVKKKLINTFVLKDDNF